MRRCARIEREKWDVEIMRLKFGNQGYIDLFRASVTVLYIAKSKNFSSNNIF
jgi:hypothetical protein